MSGIGLVRGELPLRVVIGHLVSNDSKISLRNHLAPRPRQRLRRLVYPSPNEFRVNRVKERPIHHRGSERTEKKGPGENTHSSLCALSLRGEFQSD